MEGLSFDGLTGREMDYLSTLPATTAQSAVAMDVSESRARAYRSSIHEFLGDQGAGIEKDPTTKKFHLVHPDGAGPLDEMSDTQTSAGAMRVPLDPGQKSARTKEAKQVASNMLGWLNTALYETEPHQSEYTHSEGAHDLILFRGDDHFGQVTTVPDGSGGERLVYDTAQAVTSVEYSAESAFVYAEQFVPGGSKGVENIHIAFNGDAVAGTNIYQNQVFDVEKDLYEQCFIAAKTYRNYVEYLASMFDNAQIHCHYQHGNHGKVKGRDIPDAFNVDRIAYGILDMMFREERPQRVSSVPPNSKDYTTFWVRDHLVYMRHGQKYLEHAGTSSGKHRVEGDALKQVRRESGTIPSLMIRNHYHTFKVEDVGGIPVVMAPSISPPGDFEDMLSEWSHPGGLIVGVSDQMCPSWYKPFSVPGPAEGYV